MNVLSIYIQKRLVKRPATKDTNYCMLVVTKDLHGSGLLYTGAFCLPLNIQCQPRIFDRGSSKSNCKGTEEYGNLP